MSIAEKLTTVAENVPKVYEAGQQDVLAGFTNNYTRTVFEYCFRDSDWSGLDYEKTIKATSIIAAWQNYKGEYIPANMDCSNLTIAANTAQWTCRWASKLKYFPDIKIPVVPKYGGTWQGCTSLERIEAVRCDENTVFDATFADCSRLKYVGFLGVIGQDLNMGTCSWLSKDGFIKVFECLSDTASGKTATFKKTAVSTAFGTPESSTEWQNLVATKQNWTISLV